LYHPAEADYVHAVFTGVLEDDSHVINVANAFHERAAMIRLSGKTGSAPTTVIS
jgi:hypothetical protein